MKIKLPIYPVLLALLLFPLLMNCKKNTNPEPRLNIAAVSEITYATVTCGGVITNGGGALITSCGVCWSTTQNPTIANSKTEDYPTLGSFVSHITDLTPGTTYYIKAYAKNSLGTGYSSQANFKTLTLALPVLTTATVTSVTSTTATSGGSITSDGGSSITARGVCWSTTTGPTTTLSTKTINGTGTGTFSSSITGLAAGTTYYVKAYATNSVGTAYGNEVTTITTALLPAIATVAISAITANTATSGGTITSDGGAPVTARGVCWNTTTGPTTSNSKTTDVTGTAAFTSSITGLTAGTTYYVRAYATNSVGTAYGTELNFKTLALPTITTTTASSITSTTAASGGNVTSDGGATVTARGVCWSTSTGPTTANSKTSDGTGTGLFTSSITGLTLGTTYYLRAYATNSVGTAYGTEVSFKTAYAIGEAFQGGIIAYIDGTGIHGLIATSANQSAGSQWGCSGTTIIGADGTAIGTGNQNTLDITNGCSTTDIAARICNDLVLNGYSDWYLPGKDELNTLYLNRVAIGSFASNYYWSSTEGSGTNAWSQNFASGTQYSNPKSTAYYVRAIRPF